MLFIVNGADGREIVGRVRLKAIGWVEVEERNCCIVGIDDIDDDDIDDDDDDDDVAACWIEVNEGVAADDGEEADGDGVDVEDEDEAEDDEDDG